MNYRHAYHAGNFADVFKHIVLVELISALQQKENPFLFLDTHAGAGVYDLSSEAAQKNKEYENGIRKILSEEKIPDFLKKYVSCVRAFSGKEYPGSPLIAKKLLRPQDRMVLSELHPDEYVALRKHFRNQKNAVYHEDAYQSLKIFLPPKERRGIILIDPPYEKKDELSKINLGVKEALKRFETGVYAIWYPIKDSSPLKKLSNSIDRPMLAAEFSIYPENSPAHLNGCGMLIVNPPWMLKESLEKILPWLWEKLSINKQGRFELISLN